MKRRRLSSLKYRIKSRVRRLICGIKWGYFVYKQPSWIEYESFLLIMEKRLLEMAVEFETKNITMSSKKDAHNMKRAAKLIRHYLDSKSEIQYIENKWLEDGGLDSFGGYHESHSNTEFNKARNRDHRALKLAMKIIGEEVPGWWQ